MKRIGMLALAGVFLVVLSRDAGAQWVGVTAKVGTQGPGADVTVRLLSRLNVRAGANYLDLDLDVPLDEATVNGNLKWLTFPVLLDVHPFGGGFRLSGGVVFNGSEVGLSAVPNQTIALEGTDYEVVRLDGKITFPSMAYYLGLGYGNAVGRDGRWHFSFDLGIVYADTLNADATAEASDPLLQDALNADLRTTLDGFEEDAKGLVMYPAMSIGVSFGF